MLSMPTVSPSNRPEAARRFGGYLRVVGVVAVPLIGVVVRGDNPTG
jgi:hypothetical protein